jgi:hypothetical protein
MDSKTHGSLTINVQSDSEGCLEHGIIDYCLVFGPKQTLITEPSHRLTSVGTLERLHAEKKMAKGTSGRSRPQTGLFGSHSNGLPEEKEMNIWDRIPLEDLADMQLPGKIEWFTCPEGAITVSSALRYLCFFSLFCFSFCASAFCRQACPFSSLICFKCWRGQ